MATATLLKPRRLTAYGQTWEQGVKVTVSEELAEQLDADPKERFKVRFNERGQGKPVEAPAPKPEDLGQPTGQELLLKIREAADSLDVDDDENFDRSGKPNVHAISTVLGFELTIEQRDQALLLTVDAASRTVLEAAEGQTPRKGGVRITRASAEKKEAVLKAAQAREGGDQPPANPEGGSEGGSEGEDGGQKPDPNSGTEVTVEV